MKIKRNYQIVADAIRIEVDTNSDTLYLVFKVTDKDFSKKIRDNWGKDIPVEVIDKKLIERK